MNTVVAGSAAPQPEAWRGLPHYRFGLRALSLLLIAAMRTLYRLLGHHEPSVAAWAEIVLPGGIAASFFILRSRL